VCVCVCVCVCELCPHSPALLFDLGDLEVRLSQLDPTHTHTHTGMGAQDEKPFSQRAVGGLAA